MMQKGLMAALLLGSALASAAAADSFPQRPVTIVVPFTPGGAVDIVARTVAAGLSEQWSQSVVVENKAGAGGAIGIQSVARAKPDGYTLLLGSVGPVTVNPSLGPVGYDVAKELAPVVLLAKTPAVLVTLPSAPVDDVAQFVKQAKAQPGGLNYGSAGTGNITHLVSEYFLSSAGLAANHIPYKGSAPAITDMLGGRLDFMFDVVPTAQPLIKSGKYKALAVTTIKRSDVLPDVPTLDELGYKGFDVSSWFSLMAPAGTPDAVIGQINAAVNEVLRSDASRERLAAIGAYSAGGTPEQLGEFVRSETARWKKLIDERGIRAN
ncbi:tripartite tricarboxylate transporter family receptor [Bordetella bronchiseptica 980-2]|uniref:Tripartite tricarboxylate transporter family receptor n=1 Tax=Bordetella bronchiseptica 00-P-2796 TaxID=1331199 RepID=A0ABR4RC91_BORBO|nr:tripartite tricarboxylate transporter family receptor [Bordetella bronchiseptica 980-2]KCV31744.1 tripartite tricarboxylate transporter family receptor [Bordetella bronchiseptica 00-P-2730]KCV33500.1 tripartite tricarboxylate transporter family receptor [Bordetella bronchiseptica 00-P-2796]KCV50218.1 tripartite tricarboxylate transporter family receptor [Bordetella bronchiseptica 3E44]KCV60013.1 tripartite tricarboxylate transporter family receptor [Bordetella bronchiseptica 980]KDB62501.1 